MNKDEVIESKIEQAFRSRPWRGIISVEEAIADAVRSILDGHVVLTRELAMQNHYPAIDVLASISRLERDLLEEQQSELVGRAREAMAVYRKNQDLITIGAYPAGSNPVIDQAIRWHASLQKFLRQPVRERTTVAETWSLLERAIGIPEATTPKAPTA